jgi:hypothetical protein
MKGEVYNRKMDTRDELLARILDVAVRTKKKLKINPDEQHAIFANELRNALRLTVGL